MSKTAIKRYFTHKSNGRYRWEFHILVAAAAGMLVVGSVLLFSDDRMWIEAFQLAMLFGIGADLEDWRYKEGLNERDKSSHQPGD